MGVGLEVVTPPVPAREAAVLQESLNCVLLLLLPLLLHLTSDFEVQGRL